MKGMSINSCQNWWPIQWRTELSSNLNSWSRLPRINSIVRYPEHMTSSAMIKYGMSTYLKKHTKFRQYLGNLRLHVRHPFILKWWKQVNILRNIRRFSLPKVQVCEVKRISRFFNILEFWLRIRRQIRPCVLVGLYRSSVTWNKTLKSASLASTNHVRCANDTIYSLHSDAQVTSTKHDIEPPQNM